MIVVDGYSVELFIYSFALYVYYVCVSKANLVCNSFLVYLEANRLLDSYFLKSSLLTLCLIV